MTSNSKLVLGAIAAFSLATTARADLFSYTGSMATYTVSTSGIYQIFVAGAQGGEGNGFGIGGDGAELTGNIHLSAGVVLDIIVGGLGANGFADLGAGGGGGGSFVFEPSASQPLIVAGGGGGGGYYTNGGAGQTGTSGQNGFDTQGGAGGVAGSGGHGGTTVFSGTGYNGGGGGGWLGNGTGGSGSGSGSGGSGPSTFAGASGQTPGGYGGGGGGGLDSGGGGGGYSGGGGGGRFTITGGGGGGGSYLDSSFSDITMIAGAKAGNGSVTITLVTPDLVPTPEPGALVLFGTCLLGLAGTAKRKFFS